MNPKIAKGSVALMALALVASAGALSVNAGVDEQVKVFMGPGELVPDVQMGNIGCPGLPLVSPVVLALGSDAVEDVFCLDGAAGDVVTIHADTTDPITTHDLWAGICAGDTKVFNFGTCAFFDDQVGCTFPPPAYACPRGTVTLPADGAYTIFVGSWGVWGGTWTGPYLYSLDVTVNGAPALLDLNSFDQPQTGP